MKTTKTHARGQPHLASGRRPARTALGAAGAGCGSSGQPSPCRRSPLSSFGDAQTLVPRTEEDVALAAPSFRQGPLGHLAPAPMLMATARVTRQTRPQDTQLLAAPRAETKEPRKDSSNPEAGSGPGTQTAPYWSQTAGPELPLQAGAQAPEDTRHRGHATAALHSARDGPGPRPGDSSPARPAQATVPFRSRPVPPACHRLPASPTRLWLGPSVAAAGRGTSTHRGSGSGRGPHPRAHLPAAPPAPCAAPPRAAPAPSALAAPSAAPAACAPAPASSPAAPGGPCNEHCQRSPNAQAASLPGLCAQI